MSATEESTPRHFLALSGNFLEFGLSTIVFKIFLKKNKNLAILEKARRLIFGVETGQ